MNDAPFWREPLEALLQRLGSGARGLGVAEAAARLVRYGPNTLRARPPRALVLQFLARFRNPLVLILLGASTVSALTGDLPSFVIITLIVLCSVTLDFVQEHRAARAAERLRQSVAVRATALRDGTPREVPLAELVPGDVVRLSAGDLVPADGVVLEAHDLFTNQALLTGEPYPVEKHAGAAAGEGTGLNDAENAVFMGSSVLSGSGEVLVCRTGPATALGQIAESLSRPPPPSDFERGTRRFGMLIMRLTVLLVLFVLLVNTLFHRPALESFLFAVALAVGLTPELLPMVVSVTLARGALRMARRRVIVKHLPAIQDLGSMDVLCTDKTGTLTEARIRLDRQVDASGGESQRVLRLACLNSAFETGLRSPLDEAILQHREVDLSGYRKIDEVPFDFERRRVSVLVEGRGGRLLIVKGAPEDVLRLCTQWEASEGDLRPLDAAARARAEGTYQDLCRQGFRVLGIAWRTAAPGQEHAVVTDETELCLCGFAAFLDPPKQSAARALQDLAARGVAVKIVTGDSELVTQHLCGELGLPVRGVLLGAEIGEMDDAALMARAEAANLFCRVTPAQKDRVILALRRRGHVVGYLGDGINDAPPLHSADVGISVDGAVDVAKEAASLILLEPDLGVLHEGVLEGRRTFGNVMKYILMGTSSNFGNMASMAGASLILPFLPMLPVQILLNNLLYDLSEVPIPMDRVDDEALQRPQRWDMDFIRNFMLVVGPISSAFDFLTFFLLRRVLHAGEALFHTGWFMESMATQVLVIFIIRTRGSPLRSRPSRLLTATSLAVVAVAVLLPFSPVAHYLGFVAPPRVFFPLLCAMVAAYLVAVEGAKRLFYRRFGR